MATDGDVKMIDLCAGTGAFSYAFKKVFKKSGKSLSCVYANDICATSKSIYDLNHKNELTVGDINKIKTTSIPEHSLLTGGFPCFIAGTRVLTHNGYKSIEDVSISDKLMTHTGNFRRILNLQRKTYSGTLYRFLTECHSDNIECTEEHPFYVRKHSNGTFSEPEWVKANDITTEHYFGMFINNKQINTIDRIQDAPISTIERFLDNYTRSGNKMSMNDALDLQRLYLKLSKIVSIVKSDGYNIAFNHTTSFIDNGYVWYKLRNISTVVVTLPVFNFEVDIDNSYVVQNTIVHNCQPFSMAGNKKGFSDSRSNVFWSIVKILKKREPDVFVLENVKNLQSHDKGNTFRIIYASLKKLGYHMKFKILNTCKITKIPQNRERIYIVGFKDKERCRKFHFNFAEVKCDNISKYLETNVDDKYYYDDRFKVYPMINKEVTKMATNNVLYQYRRFYVRECKSNVCPTLTANMGGGGHNVPILRDKKGIRKLTPRECFNLQGFPANYKLPNLSDSKLYKLAGNAVSVPVVQLIAERILTSILAKSKI